MEATYCAQIGIDGLCRIGKEFTIRGKVLGMEVYAIDMHKDEAFVIKNKIN